MIRTFAVAILAAGIALACATRSRAELVLHLEFENASDLTEDSSGLGKVGVIGQVGAGGTVTQGAGVVGSGAVEFTSVDADNGPFLDFADQFNFQDEDSFAITFWVNPDASVVSDDTGFRSFLTGRTNSGDTGDDFQFDHGGNAPSAGLGAETVARIAGGIEVELKVDGNGEGMNLPAGAWTQVGLVSRSAGPLQRDQYLYVDGELRGRFTDLGGLSMQDLIVGSNLDRTRAYDGLVDDVKVYDNAATKEVLDDMGSTIPRVVVNRETREVTLSNPSNSAAEIVEYEIRSTRGALDSGAWTPISGRLDDSGDGTFDPDDDWIVLPGENDSNILSEGTLGLSTFGASQTVQLGPAWIANPDEELYASFLLSDGSVLELPVAFEGNGGNPYSIGDFNTDGFITPADWTLFKANLGADLSSETALGKYFGGDLDSDGDNDLDDYIEFERLYNTANPLAPLAQVIARVPEPSSAALVLISGLVLACRCRRHRLVGVVFPLAAAFGFSIAYAPTDAQAVELGYWNLDETSGPAIDSVNGLNSVAIGSDVLQGTLGRSGGGYYFAGLGSGARNSVSFGDITNSALSTAILNGDGTGPGSGAASISMWINLSEIDFANSQYASAVSFGNISSNSRYMSAGVGGTSVSAQVGPPEDEVAGSANGNSRTNSNRFLGSKSSVADGFWHHVVYSVEDTATDVVSDDGVRALLYVDGVLVNEVNAPADDDSQPLLDLPDVISNLVFGDLADSTPNQPFRGFLDEVRIFDTVLNETEVANIFNTTPENDLLTLEVDRGTGEVNLVHPANQTSPLVFGAYSISSASGSLDPQGWVSLEDSDFEGAGPTNDGTGWEEGGQSDEGELIEAFLLGSSALATTDQPVSLGAAFTPGGMEDLVFRYERELNAAETAFGLDPIVGGKVVYVGNRAGDYDGDGDVDSDDYLAWKTGFGSAVAPGSGADGNRDGIVNLADYTVWRDNLGAESTSIAAVSHAVPEPTALLLVATGLWMTAARRRLS